MKLTRYTRLATAVVAGALVLTACGRDDNTDVGRAALGATAPAATTARPEP